ncbi:MetQ/NlpA family ABC transporter substrate-binding protein [Gordonia rubripertincta]|uniref:MetQ/NlpA family ABC transporter substrate-binding protein n=1 Tax=Gordonia rubripertincta TaxID=36822 RepID=UPI000B8DB4E9|nr:MetQ/NlpA family ABC transporter substrate-binding protein [Gordonia rubripertincta]ASR01711.1 Methionine-binding lipoprotein MetQ precursor [Gordonia rubripertincta]
MAWSRVTSALVSALVLVAGCSAGTTVRYEETGTAGDALTVLAGGEGYRDVLHYVVDHDLAPGVRLTIADAGDDANSQVADGRADLAFFQIRPAFNGEVGGELDERRAAELSVASAVDVAPYALYSSKWQDVAPTQSWLDAGIVDDRITGRSLPHGATVGVPGTPAGLARSLYLLQSANLVRLDRPFGGTQAGDLSITEANVVESQRHLTLRQIDTDFGADAHRNLDAVILDPRSAAAAGLVPARDALAIEPGPHNPYARVLVAPARLAGDPRISALARALEGQQVADYLAKRYSGAIISVHIPFSTPRLATAGR